MEYEHGDAAVKKELSLLLEKAAVGDTILTTEDIPAIFLRHYPAYKKGSLNVSELVRVCDISRTTVYKYIELLER